MLLQVKSSDHSAPGFRKSLSEDEGVLFGLDALDDRETLGHGLVADAAGGKHLAEDVQPETNQDSIQ